MRTAIEHIPILISALAFLTMLSLFLVVFIYVRQYARRREWVAKIQRNGLNLELTEEKDPEKPSFKTENIILQRVLDFFGNLGKRLVPEKSTYFAPKILSGIIIYKHTIKKIK